MKSNSNLTAVFVGFIVAAVAIIVFSHVPEVFAQATDGSGGFVPCGNTADNPCQIGHLFAAFIVIINYLITMAGFIAIVAIVFAGFTMIYSQGQEQLKAAKGRFSGAVIGLVLVAAAFILINAIFAGSFSLGVRDGAKVLTSPLDYIKGTGTTTSPTTTPPKPTTKP